METIEILIIIDLVILVLLIALTHFIKRFEKIFILSRMKMQKKKDNEHAYLGALVLLEFEKIFFLFIGIILITYYILT